MSALIIDHLDDVTLRKIEERAAARQRTVQVRNC